MWVLGLPLALVPLWQEEQVPITSVWLTVLAGAQAALVWQSAQLVLVAMWVADLPVAVVPLWQLAQLPAIPAWEKVAGVQPLVL